MTAPRTTVEQLACGGLSVRRGGREILHNIDLTLGADECVSLVGPNGSGKSTLLLTLLGLLTPSAGRATLAGRDLCRLAPRVRGRFAAYVPQSLPRVPAFAVYDVVAGGRHPHVSPLGRLSADDHARIRAALAQCGLADLAQRPLNTLSGGERQKVLIAAAIAQDPRMMLLDEPGSALDPAYQLELVRLLRDWHIAGRGLIVVSHDLQLPAALGGRVIALHGGRIAADGPAGAVLTPDVLTRIYGGRFESLLTAEGLRIVLPAWWACA